MRNQTNFNAIAPVYDQLCQMVFGKTHRYVQIGLLRYIKPNSKVLIVGGGTGWVLEEISKQLPTSLEITYIEKSIKMLAISQKRDAAQNRVIYINEPLENCNLASQNYDVVFTPFLFDCFTEASLQQAFLQLGACLKPNGLWLYADFKVTQGRAWWQKPILSLMYLFFRVVSRVDARTLVPVSTYFAPYKLVAEQQFVWGFIVGQVYQKPI